MTANVMFMNGRGDGGDMKKDDMREGDDRHGGASIGYGSAIAMASMVVASSLF